MGGWACGGESLEIYMRGQVRVTRGFERINVLMRSEGLKRVTKGPPIAIVKDKGGAAVGFNLVADSTNDASRGGAGFDDVARFSVFQTMRKIRIGSFMGKPKAQIVELSCPTSCALRGSFPALTTQRRSC